MTDKAIVRPPRERQHSISTTQRRRQGGSRARRGDWPHDLVQLDGPPIPAWIEAIKNAATGAWITMNRVANVAAIANPGDWS